MKPSRPLLTRLRCTECDATWGPWDAASIESVEQLDKAQSRRRAHVLRQHPKLRMNDMTIAAYEAQEINPLGIVTWIDLADVQWGRLAQGLGL